MIANPSPTFCQSRTIVFWKRLHGAKLDGAKHFQKNCQNVPGAAGPAAGAAAASAAASAVCIYYVIIGGRFAPPYKYMIKCIQQKQQQLQQQPQQLQPGSVCLIKQTHA